MTEPKKRYRVGYWLTASYVVTVEASSGDEACDLVRSMLDAECDVLPGSERVYFDCGVADAEERPAAKSADPFSTCR